MDILERCGIVTKLPTPTVPWQEAEATVYGAEHYVLGTKRITAKLLHDARGYKLIFKHVEAVSFNDLTDHYPVVTIHDIEIAIPGTPGLSMARMRPGEYPAVLRDQEILRIS